MSPVTNQSGWNPQGAEGHSSKDGLLEWPVGEPACDIWAVWALVSHVVLQHACLGRKTSVSIG